MSLLDNIVDKFSEASYFLDMMQSCESNYRAKARWGSLKQPPDVMVHLHEFRYNLSGFLAATQALREYVRHDQTLNGDRAVAWRRSADQEISFRAFRELRDTNIHRNTILIGGRFGVTMKQSADGTQTGEVSGADFVFAERTLGQYPKFAGKQAELSWLCEAPATILTCATQYMHDIGELVKRGKLGGLL